MSSVPNSIDVYESADEEYEEYYEEAGWSIGDTPAWVVSMMLHVAILAPLAWIVQETVEPFSATIVSEMEEEEIDYKLDSTDVDVIGSDSTLNRQSPSLASATRQGMAPQQQVEPIVEDFDNLEIPPQDQVQEPNRNELTDVVDRTGTTEHPGGVPGAVDRITMEIRATLRDDRAVVCWLFDRSPSVNQRREQIASRFRRVYEQLDMLEPDSQHSLVTSVAAFGKDFTLVTESPVDDPQSVVEAIRGIEPEPSGEENVFTAVKLAAQQHMSYRRGSRKREVMIIVVTDEAGSDQLQVEDTVKFLRRNSIRCYVVGNAAPFGRKEVEIPWEYEGETVTAVLEPGPETFLPELIQLPFWSVGTRDLRNMSSGFGPYALTRLCVETGGLYLVTEDTNGPRFDHDVLRNYAPDYSTPKRYVENLAKNEAKVSLISTIAMFDPAVKRDPVMATLLQGVLGQARTAYSYAQLPNLDVPTPQRVFDAPNDNVLRTQLAEAQEPFAIFRYPLEKIETHLLAGEKSRDEIEEPRWRANYDLAVGRLLAMRARAEGYDKALAGMKVAPRSFEKQGSNEWHLEPSRDIDGGPKVRKLAKRAEEYLRRVIDEHPGTPWAVLAQRELSQPMGWQWKEAKKVVINTGRRQMNNNGENRPRPQFAPDDPRRRMVERRQRPAPPIRIKI